MPDRPKTSYLVLWGRLGKAWQKYGIQGIDLLKDEIRFALMKETGKGGRIK